MRHQLRWIAAIGLVLIAADGTDDRAKIREDLASANRDVRIAAIERLSRAGDLGEGDAMPLVSFVMLEFRQAASPADGLADSGPVGRQKLRTGDETSLVRIKTNPRKHLDVEFILVGGIRISDEYEIPFNKMQDTYHCFEFREIGDNSEPILDEKATLYVKRSIGGGLAERVAQAQDKGLRYLVARLRCKIESRFVFGVGTQDRPLNSITVKDWQFYSERKGTWGEPAFSRIPSALALLAVMGKAAVPSLVDAATTDAQLLNEASDNHWKLLLAETIAKMDAEAKGDAMIRLRSIFDKTKSDRIRAAARTCGQIVSTTGVAPKTPGKPAKAIDRKTRAATLLKSARNLEAAGKTAGALALYRDIVKTYPGTEEAKAAKGRIDALLRP